MIRLRQTLERWRRHPVLGPLVLVVLALLLVVVFLHAAHEGFDGATTVGGFCFVVVAVLGAMLLDGVRRLVPMPVSRVVRERGPPSFHAIVLVRQPAVSAAGFVLPLRR